MELPFIKYLKDSSDRTDFTNDYSTTNADAAVLSVPDGVSYLAIDELAFSFIVSATGQQPYGTFMQSGTLANGIEVKIYDATPTELVDLTDGLPIKDMLGFYHRSISPIFLVVYDIFTPYRQEGLCIWRFQEPLILRAGHTLEVELNDDLSNGANLVFSINARGRSVS